MTLKINSIVVELAQPFVKIVTVSQMAMIAQQKTWFKAQGKINK